MKTYFPYNINSTQIIQNEQHTIVDGKIRLLHIPAADSLTVDGFVVAVHSVDNLQPKEFYYAYSRESYYRDASRLVYFSKTCNGTTVNCSYTVVGSPVTADDMNEIGDRLSSSESLVAALQLQTVALGNNILAARTEAAMNLAAHNSDLNAHPELRDLIDAAVTQHNTNVNSHSGILDLIADEATQRLTEDMELFSLIDGGLSALGSLSDALADHEENTFAHPYLMNLIAEEESARINADNEINTRLDNLIPFGGITTALPTPAIAGTLIIADGKPYISDGNDWLNLGGGGASSTLAANNFIDFVFDGEQGGGSHVKPGCNCTKSSLAADDFIDFVFGGASSTVTAVEFIPYVFNDVTPETYNGDGKSDFIPVVFDGSSSVADSDFVNSVFSDS